MTAKPIIGEQRTGIPLATIQPNALENLKKQAAFYLNLNRMIQYWKN